MLRGIVLTLLVPASTYGVADAGVERKKLCASVNTHTTPHQ